MRLDLRPDAPVKAALTEISSRVPADWAGAFRFTGASFPPGLVRSVPVFLLNVSILR